jgi:adenylate kinase
MHKITFTLLLIACTTLYSAKHFILISAPGSGKGTFSQHMVAKHNYVQICPGDIFRNEIKMQTSLGKRIKPIVDAGHYLDEELVCSIMQTKLQEALEHNCPIILDGFPRSNESFAFLHAFLDKNNLLNDVVFIQFIAPDQTCIQRICQRVICTTCFKVYNTAQLEHTNDQPCTQCGASLSKRSADTQHIAQERIAYFHQHVEPLMALAQKQYKTLYIDVSQQTITALEEYYDALVQ